MNTDSIAHSQGTGLSILGSTGSIGRSALDIVRAHPDRFRVRGLACGKNLDLILLQAREFRPEILSVDESLYLEVAETLSGSGIRVVAGEEGACEVAALQSAEVLLSAIVGEAGLAPTWEGIFPGRTVALANKETLVVGGQTVIDRVNERGARLVPVDSEHSAIYQAMAGHRWSDVRRIILTASGGPFFGKKRTDLERVTRDQALNHPTWKMGPKITIDSATLLNKGLEMIEARWLFDVPADRIEVVVHRQSIIHSMVELRDASVLAQMGVPDMKGPIAYALSGEERLPVGVPFLDLVATGQLTFFAPDHETFPAIRLAARSISRPGQGALYLNMANEVAVAAFLAGKISFTDIFDLWERVLDEAPERIPGSLSEIREAVSRATSLARDAVMRQEESHVTSLSPSRS
jgi:1-deoxy-D-xylulose-5-phosphate reductoisomerase